MSWTVDRKDPLTRSKGDEVIVLMFADETGRALALGWVYAVEMKSLWKPTFNLAHKVAIYYGDIKRLVRPFGT